MKNKRMFKMATPKLFSLSVLAASALAISSPAMADWKHKEVQYSDLDLSSPVGQQRFKTRIKMAVKQVCASPSPSTLAQRADRTKCQKESMARAMPKAEKAIAAYMENRRFASKEANAIVGN
jgi:UrcA family protein